MVRYRDRWCCIIVDSVVHEVDFGMHNHWLESNGLEWDSTSNDNYFRVTLDEDILYVSLAGKLTTKGLRILQEILPNMKNVKIESMFLSDEARKDCIYDGSFNDFLLLKRIVRTSEKVGD